MAHFGNIFTHSTHVKQAAAESLNAALDGFEEVQF
jgi:hypothetical protein